jgi:hypothetical protein
LNILEKVLLCIDQKIDAKQIQAKELKGTNYTSSILHEISILMKFRVEVKNAFINLNNE